MTQEAQDGDTVQVHYTGRLDDGSVFDSSREDEPLEFELGSGRVIPGFESAVSGMSVGESLEVELEPDEAYGERRDDLVMPVERDQLPEQLEPEVGDALEVQLGSGERTTATVVDADDASVTLDLNHPLAGRTLNFELELLDIV